MKIVCEVDGCSGDLYARGMCQRHYHQVRRTGKILERTPRDPNTFRERDDGSMEMDIYDMDQNVVAVVLIDAEDYELVSKRKWSLIGQGKYIASRYAGQTEYLHRVLLGLSVRDSRNVLIDHKNGDRWDNRRSNLRKVSNGTNLRNSVTFQGRRRGVKKRRDGLWQATITISVDSEEAALEIREIWENARDKWTGDNALIDPQ